MCKQPDNYVQFCQDNGGSKPLLPAPVPAVLHLPLPGPARAAAEERGAGRWRLHWHNADQPAPGGMGGCSSKKTLFFLIFAVNSSYFLIISTILGKKMQ